MTPEPFACIPRHLFADPRIRGSLHVLGVIVSHANQRTGLAFPSLATIAEECGGLSRGTVSEHIGHLVAAKVLLIARPGGGRRSTVYRLPWVIHNRAATPRESENDDGRSARPDRAKESVARGHTERSARWPIPGPAQTQPLTDHVTGVNAREILTTGPRRAPRAPRELIDTAIAESRRAKPARPRASYADWQAARAGVTPPEYGGDPPAQR